MTTDRLRSLFGVMLAVILALTGQSMAVARGASAATGTIVICVGQETETVFVDAQGKPTTAPHLCPDCMLALSAVPVFEAVEFTTRSYLVAQVRQSRLVLVAVDFGGFMSRAPPRPA